LRTHFPSFPNTTLGAFPEHHRDSTFILLQHSRRFNSTEPFGAKLYTFFYILKGSAAQKPSYPFQQPTSGFLRRIFFCALLSAQPHSAGFFTTGAQTLQANGIFPGITPSLLQLSFPHFFPLRP